MNYLLPIESLYKISKEHAFLTWGVFLLYISFPTLLGYTPSYPKNFFYPSEHYIWNIYFSYMDIIHTKTSNLIFSFIFKIFEFWIIYLFAGVKKTIKFRIFLLPFLSYAFIGIILRIVDFFPSIQIFSPPIGVVVTIYYFIFFICVLMNIYSLKLLKSAFIVLFAFLVERILSFLLSGLAIGMILQELKI